MQKSAAIKTGVTVELRGPDVPPKELLAQILAETDRFCKEEGHPGVEHVIIGYNAKEQAASVMYRCIGEAP